MKHDLKERDQLIKLSPRDHICTVPLIAKLYLYTIIEIHYHQTAFDQLHVTTDKKSIFFATILPKRWIFTDYLSCLSYIQTMFDVTLQDRLASFHSAPGTAMFLHWLVGMVYVFYFASFVLLLREVGALLKIGYLYL